MFCDVSLFMRLRWVMIHACSDANVTDMSVYMGTYACIRDKCSTLIRVWVPMYPDMSGSMALS